ncbi:MAG TPA: PAS domain S-box protein, partial [Acidimicrobiales bacterium]|nr:PAS domain S-box protein [Acidimicrobiales bacterium]
MSAAGQEGRGGESHRRGALDQLAAVARALFGATIGYLITEDGSVHIAPETAPASTRSLVVSVAERVIALDGPTVIPDVVDTPAFSYLEASGVRFCAAAPMAASDGTVRGVVGALGPKPLGEIDELTEGLTALAGIAAQVLVRRGSGGVDLDSLLEHSSDVIVVLNDEGRLTYASPSLEALTGFAPEDVIGKYGFELVHPDERPAIVHLFARLHENPEGALPVSFRLARSDSTYLDVEAVTTSVTDESAVHGIVVNIRDVTVRRRIEETAR